MITAHDQRGPVEPRREIARASWSRGVGPALLLALAALLPRCSDDTGPGRDATPFEQGVADAPAVVDAGPGEYSIQWSGERSTSSWSQWVWRTQLYDLQGQALAPVQDLAVKASHYFAVVSASTAMMIPHIYWTGSDFEMFYNWASGYSAQLHLARLRIRKTTP